MDDTEPIIDRIKRNDPRVTELILCPVLHEEEVVNGKACYFPDTEESWGKLCQNIGRNTRIISLQINLWGDLNDLGFDYFSGRSLALICEGLGQNRHIRILSINHCHFDMFETGSIQALLPFLEHNQNLREISFDLCCTGSEGTLLLSGALERRVDKSIEVVDVSSDAVRHEDTDAESKSVHALLISLKGYPNLKRLNLTGRLVGLNGCKVLSTLLENPQTKLEKLCLDNSGIDNSILPILVAPLTNNSTLQSLDLSKNELITKSGWEPLLCLLRNPRCKLTSLSLNKFSVGDDLAAGLSTSLATNCTLKSLHLSCTRMNTAGWEAISTLLQSPESKLRDLYFKGLHVTDDHAVIIANALANNHALKQISFAYNRRITSRGVTAFSAALRSPMSQLECLDLNRVTIDEDATIALAAALANNNKLKTLNLGTPFSDDTLTDRVWKAFYRTIFNSASINDVYQSNHMLESLGSDYEGQQTSFKAKAVKSLLTINKWDSSRKGYIKILMFCFGDGIFDLEPFAEMDAQLLVHILAWIGRPTYNTEMISVSGRAQAACTAQSAMFQLLRGLPSLFGSLASIKSSHPTKVDADGNSCKRLRC